MKIRKPEFCSQHLLWALPLLPLTGLGVALLSQYVLGWQPCPLCIMQRIFLVLTMTAGFVVVAFWKKATLLIYALFAAAGASVAGYQSWLLFQPPAPECGSGGLGWYLWQFTEKFPATTWLLDAPGNCQSTEYSLMGVPLPIVSLFFFVGLTMLAWACARVTQKDGVRSR